MTLAYNLLLLPHKALPLYLFKRVLLGLVCSLSLNAHPHIFIDIKLIPDVEKVTIVWTFDAMSSAMLIGDYDKNKDKQLSAEEIAIIDKEHFKTLAPYSYFMRFFDGKNENEVTHTQNFHATIEKKRLVYSFCIPTLANKSYELRFFDPEMYVAMILKKEGLMCSKHFTCKTQGYDADFYYAYKAVITS